MAESIINLTNTRGLVKKRLLLLGFLSIKTDVFLLALSLSIPSRVLVNKCNMY